MGGRVGIVWGGIGCDLMDMGLPFEMLKML